jgi:hypothetical protein
MNPLKWHLFTDDEIIESATTKKWLAYRCGKLRKQSPGCYSDGRNYVATDAWMSCNGFGYLLIA